MGLCFVDLSTARPTSRLSDCPFHHGKTSGYLLVSVVEIGETVRILGIVFECKIVGLDFE